MCDTHVEITPLWWLRRHIDNNVDECMKDIARYQPGWRAGVDDDWVEEDREDYRKSKLNVRTFLLEAWTLAKEALDKEYPCE